eukprot:scaffold76205_cov59-Phaeocystis_antarctica.AAC.4
MQARLSATFEGAAPSSAAGGAVASAAGGAAAAALAASLSAFSAASASRTSLVAAPRSGCCSRSLASSGLKPRPGSATRSPRTASRRASVMPALVWSSRSTREEVWRWREPRDQGRITCDGISIDQTPPVGRLLHHLYNRGEALPRQLVLRPGAREAIAGDDDPEGAAEAALGIEAAHHLVHRVEALSARDARALPRALVPRAVALLLSHDPRMLQGLPRRVALHGCSLEQAAHQVPRQVRDVVGPAELVLAVTYTLEELGAVAAAGRGER